MVGPRSEHLFVCILGGLGAEAWLLRVLWALDPNHLYLLCLLPLLAAIVAKMGLTQKEVIAGAGWVGRNACFWPPRTLSLVALCPGPGPPRHAHTALDKVEHRAGKFQRGGDSSGMMLSFICTNSFSPCL